MHQSKVVWFVYNRRNPKHTQQAIKMLATQDEGKWKLVSSIKHMTFMLLSESSQGAFTAGTA